MHTTIFDNVRVFDGRSDQLSEPTTVRIAGNRIESIGVVASPDSDHLVIAGGGRVLMPGLIDVHTHLMFSVPPMVALQSDMAYLGINAAAEATAMLMRGFTSVRDAGGPIFGLKRAIDQGLVPGPRIWPSGAFISQTAGHGDFRSHSEFPRGICGHLTRTELAGAAVIADGVPEVLRGVREQLAQGASQIKVMAGGGVASPSDPLDVSQYSDAELRAAVEAAADWGTYVMVHAYTSRAVQRAVSAGVKCIEHGQLIDADTVAFMAEHNVWWSLQPFLADEHSNQHDTAQSRAKQLEVAEGTDRAYALAREYGVRVAWGTDALFDRNISRLQGHQLVKMSRWFTPAEVLRMATSTNADLLALSGPRSPYQGQLGVIEVGAVADLLLVDGDPLTDLSLLSRPESSLMVIMKDGQIQRNVLGG